MRRHTILALVVALAPTPGVAQQSDVLFVVLGKMSLYDQDVNGSITLRDHHFVAEIMPKEGGTVLGGTLTSRDRPSEVYTFESEGEAFLTHGGRFDNAAAMHRNHPDGEYVFDYETASGRVESQVLKLARRPDIKGALDAYRITLSQSSGAIAPDAVDPQLDLKVTWTLAPEMSAQPDGLVDDLTFVLAFDCFGNRVAHSGRPFQGGPYLTFNDDTFVIPADALSSGTRYALIVEQATADTTMHEGIPGIATYATLTFLDFETTGEPARACPER